MAGEKDRDKPDDKQPRDETGDWRKGGNGDGTETGGPLGIKIKVEDPGVVRINFDRPVDTLVLQPLDALMLCQAVLQNAIMCANPPKSRIIVPR